MGNSKAAGVEFAMEALGFRGYSGRNGTLARILSRILKMALKWEYISFTGSKQDRSLEEAKTLYIDNIKEYRLDYPVYFDTEPITADDFAGPIIWQGKNVQNVWKHFAKQLQGEASKAEVSMPILNMVGNGESI